MTTKYNTENRRYTYIYEEIITSRLKYRTIAERVLVFRTNSVYNGYSRSVNTPKPIGYAKVRVFET